MALWILDQSTTGIHQEDSRSTRAPGLHLSGARVCFRRGGAGLPDIAQPSQHWRRTISDVTALVKKYVDGNGFEEIDISYHLWKNESQS
jgi:hypothetical protein